MLVEAGMGQAAPAAYQEAGSWCELGLSRGKVLRMLISRFLLGESMQAEQGQALPVTWAPGLFLQ